MDPPTKELVQHIIKYQYYSIHLESGDINELLGVIIGGFITILAFSIVECIKAWKHFRSRKISSKYRLITTLEEYRTIRVIEYQNKMFLEYYRRMTAITDDKESFNLMKESLKNNDSYTIQVSKIIPKIKGDYFKFKYYNNVNVDEIIQSIISWRYEVPSFEDITKPQELIQAKKEAQSSIEKQTNTELKSRIDEIVKLIEN